MISVWFCRYKNLRMYPQSNHWTVLHGLTYPNKTVLFYTSKNGAILTRTSIENNPNLNNTSIADMFNRFYLQSEVDYANC